jgi:hypothetical protein
LFRLTDTTEGSEIDLAREANQTYVDDQLPFKTNLLDVYRETATSKLLTTLDKKKGLSCLCLCCNSVKQLVITTSDSKRGLYDTPS